MKFRYRHQLQATPLRVPSPKSTNSCSRWQSHFTNMFSPQVRCLGLLAMPTFCDKTGQRVLVAMIFSYVMAGPLNNITRNGSEVIRVFTCSTTLVYNLTKTRYELMFKPFHEALFSLKVRFDAFERVVL